MRHVLFIGEDTSRFINRNFYYLEQELARIVRLTVWRKSGNIEYILKRLETKPDFILILNDMGHQLFPMIKGLRNCGIPTGLFVTDVHRLVKIRENYINKNKIDYLFTIGWEQSVQTYPQLKHKLEWFPHFVHPGIYKDYFLEKDIEFLMIGAVNRTYPLREKIVNAYSKDPRFICYHHPGYRDFTREEEKDKRVGEHYAKELNRTKIFFTCPSIYNYPVMKYYEALACKTLLLAPTFNELEGLGFIPGKHFVAIDESNFKEKADYYLANEKERQRITEQGHQFIQENHTVRIRAKQLMEKIEGILESE